MTDEKQNKSNIPSDMIERLKKEKKQSEDKYFKQGYSYGKEAVQNMSYDELRQVISWHKVYVEAARDSDLYYPGIFVDTSLFEEGHWFRQAIYRKNDTDIAFDMANYLRGVVKAVVEFWEEVSEEL